MNTKNLLIVCVTLLIVGVLFWPTLYRYERIDVQGLSAPVRINRLTGYTEYFMLGEWRPEERRKKQRQAQPLPVAARSLLKAKASVSSRMFNGEVYNGSDWTVTSVTFRVVAKERSGSVRWDRKFKETIRVNPLSASYFAMTVTESEDIADFDWQIDEVFGYKVK